MKLLKGNHAEVRYACTYLAGRRGENPATVILTDGELHTIISFGELSVWTAPFMIVEITKGHRTFGTQKKRVAHNWAERRELWQYLKALA